jgi:hypothetical protein
MRWSADFSDSERDRGFDLILRDAFLALRLGWITLAEAELPVHRKPA